MGRKRDLETSEWFHVTNRGADRQDIVVTDDDRDALVDLLADTVEEFPLEVTAFALMTNHFHLVLGAPERCLPAAMNKLEKGYAVRFNRRTSRTGPLFDHRYVSVPIEDDEMFLTECRYVHRNPISIVGPERLEFASFSSLGCYVGVRPRPPWLSTRRLGGMIDPSSYADHVRRTLPSDRVTARGRPALVATTLDEILDAVERVTGETALDPSAPRRGRRADGRTLAAALATDLRVDDAVVLAQRFGIAPASFRNLASRGRRRRAVDAAFAAVYDAVLHAL